MKHYNQMIFDSKDDITKFNSFLNTLISYNSESTQWYNDIHIYQEESMIVLQWVQVPYSHVWGGSFEFVDENERILREVILPDNSYEYAENDAEEKEILNNWLKEHPTWKKSSYGNWYEEFNNDDSEEISFSGEARNDR